MKNVSQGSGHSLGQPGQCFGRNGNLMAGDPDCGFCEKLHDSATDTSATCGRTTNSGTAHVVSTYNGATHCSTTDVGSTYRRPQNRTHQRARRDNRARNRHPAAQ